MSEVVFTHQANPGAQGSGLSSLYFNAAGQLCRVGNDGVEVVVSADALSWKQAVRAATTAALPTNTYSNGVSGVGATLTATANGALAAQDGVTLAAGERLLVKNESAGANNGLYRLTQVGDGSTPYILTRVTDADSGAELIDVAVKVSEGTTNGDQLFVCTTNAPITVGTTAIAFSQLGASGGASTTQSGEMMCGLIVTPADGDYKIVVKAAHAGTITETTTISVSGTCTATFKINTTALGGTANSVSSTEQSQSHGSANVFVAGDDIVITISANSSCSKFSFTIKYTRTLS